MDKLVFIIVVVFFISCKKSDTINPCGSYFISSSKTSIQIAEFLYDSAFLVPDTVLAGELTDFKFTNPYKANIQSVLWDIDNGGKLSSNTSFYLRFINTGAYTVKLIVTYLPFDQCDKRTSFSDTVQTKLYVIQTDHSSRLEGNYIGFLETNPNIIFTVSIKYWKYPGDDIGGYYIRNYVNGCTGDGLNSNIPFGTGYEIISGYKSFNMSSYPCNAPSNFRGFGYLNYKGDSLTIKHFGYNSPIFVAGDTIPHWNTFKGKKI